jgi:hypothetical protein
MIMGCYLNAPARYPGLATWNGKRFKTHFRAV